MDMSKFLKIPTSYFKKTEADISPTLRHPVTFENGDRIQGFTSEIQDKVFGVTKTGQEFVAPTSNYAMYNIIPKANNKPASKTEQAMRELIDNELQKTQTNKVNNIRMQRMPDEPGMPTGLGPIDALINSIL